MEGPRYHTAKFELAAKLRAIAKALKERQEAQDARGA